MLCEGEPICIEWAKDSVTLPTVPAPENHPTHAGKMAPTSGTRLGVSGLTGDGIRGSLKTLTDGSLLRPDFVLLDDPQSDKSALSPTQNQRREALISGAVLGMAGPGKKMSAVMPCTVIQRGDMVDNILDRTKHPMWRGTRAKLVDGWPVNFQLWERYFELYRMDGLLEPPNFERSKRFYLENQEAMDAGATATWEDRKEPDEVSALQHAMHFYCRDPIMFASEYQNEPIDIRASSGFLDAISIMGKQHSAGQNELPIEVETVKAFIDCQKEQFFWQIWGYSAGFDGYLIDYGSYPEQPTGYYQKTQISNTLTKNYPNMGLEARIYAGLNDLIRELAGREWLRQEDGTEFRISRIGIDSGYQTATIRKVYRESQYRDRLTLTMGQGYGVAQRPMSDKTVKAGDVKGSHWFYARAKTGSVRTVEIDTNFWKSFFHRRLMIAIGDPGCFSLYNVENNQYHRLVAEHWTAEYCTPDLPGKYCKVDLWSEKPGKPDNDFFDCAVGCAVMASFDGLQMVGLEAAIDESRERPRADWSKWKRR